MGFSLVGNSGDSNQSTTNYNYTASSNPQLDFQNATGSNLGISFAPIAQGGSTGAIDPDIYYYDAPIDINNTGEALGDSAVNALSSIAQAQSAAQGDGGSSSSLSLSSLLSGNGIYYILGAIVLFFLAEGDF